MSGTAIAPIITASVASASAAVLAAVAVQIFETKRNKARLDAEKDRHDQDRADALGKERRDRIYQDYAAILEQVSRLDKRVSEMMFPLRCSLDPDFADLRDHWRSELHSKEQALWKDLKDDPSEIRVVRSASESLQVELEDLYALCTDMQSRTSLYTGTFHVNFENNEARLHSVVAMHPQFKEKLRQVREVVRDELQISNQTSKGRQANGSQS